jgi:hypothetical protein
MGFGVRSAENSQVAGYGRQDSEATGSYMEPEFSDSYSPENV